MTGMLSPEFIQSATDHRANALGKCPGIDEIIPNHGIADDEIIQ